MRLLRCISSSGSGSVRMQRPWSCTTRQLATVCSFAAEEVEQLASLGSIGLPEVDFAYRLATGVVQLNHGSFGAVLEPVRVVETRLREAWK